ncbi:MAG: hypothetical protein ACQETB_07110 [Halobacteriota archaeon]
MQIRDAVEADAEAIAAIVDAPVEVMRNLVHDRTVRVATHDDARTADPNVDTAGSGSSILGFVSFDAREGTVHVTQFGGRAPACEALLAEPIRFASNEGMDVELLVEAADDALREAVEAAGFTMDGPGPMVEDTETRRYRLQP